MRTSTSRCVRRRSVRWSNPTPCARRPGAAKRQRVRPRKQRGLRAASSSRVNGPRAAALLLVGVLIGGRSGGGAAPPLAPPAAHPAHHTTAPRPPPSHHTAPPRP